MFNRNLFGEEHEAFRDMVRKFIAREIAPHHAAWETEGVVPRALWRKAGAAGMLCCTIPEEYGGIGADYLFDVVVFEEMARSGFTGPGFMIHCDLVATYIKSFGSEAQVEFAITSSRPKRGRTCPIASSTETASLTRFASKACRHSARAGLALPAAWPGRCHWF